MVKGTDSIPAYIQVKSFPGGNGMEETFLVIGTTGKRLSFDEQKSSVWRLFSEYQNEHPEQKTVFERWFLSDASQQQTAIEELRKDAGNAVSIIEQPPLDGTKIALLVHLQSQVNITPLQSGLFQVSHNGLNHLWTSSRRASGKNSREQAKELLLSYSEQISEQRGTLADNCIRTWFFVQDIDNNYHGVVTARNDVFSTQGLTRDTHFIASTGIGGRSADHRNTVQFEAYSIEGISEEQISYIQAPTHLNPTYEYGVSFERGTSVTYGDRKHIFISGTASIDNTGSIVHPGDIIGQTHRMTENVQALLSVAGARLNDMMYAIVYLRDIADYQLVQEILSKKLAGIPYVITYAPVCRPGWLIEMECMAITPDGDSRFKAL